MKRSFTLLFVLALLCIVHHTCLANDGYNLWLQYRPLQNAEHLSTYQKQVQFITLPGQSATSEIIQEELHLALGKMLGTSPEFSNSPDPETTLIIGTRGQLPDLSARVAEETWSNLDAEGFIIQSIQYNGENTLWITGNTDQALLYGTFDFLKLLQTHQDISSLDIISIPKTKIRVLNHWDNPDRTVERGYAGASIWDWHRLPDYIKPQYIDYARANASIGINGTVLTNVNANAQVLTPYFLKKVAALADTFRPYGIKVYLTARFSAPIETGGLDTADPLNPDVQKWWNKKVNEIYDYIPDFGGFLVKADSEGQPGPQNYGLTQAEGANMLAKALQPHQGIVMWRAFVYNNETPDDRAKQAYNEFKPLDGEFEDNVLVQVKNGAIDFQPREPFHPLFGAMPKTPLMMEFQITQEYLGQGTHLVFLGSLFEEVLGTDTYAKGPGSTVAKVVDGSLDNHSLSGMAGVSNIGTDRNWTGHQFGQANWYAFGKLAWNPDEDASTIAQEWLRMTFGNDEELVTKGKRIMLQSHEAAVNYMTPLGLHHIMGWSHHYGPGPWVTDKHRDDWTSTYYHQAGPDGIGFDRTASGSNALSQYAPEIQQQYGDLNTCPEKYLLWFHHLPWDYKMKSGNALWNEIALHYQKGVDQTQSMLADWESIKNHVDDQRYDQVLTFLQIQHNEAIWWKDACLLYFQQFSQKPLPEGVPQPEFPLDHFQNYKPLFVPGI
ncbi:alpha-glucuronidase [Echinicola soli]|uniref:Xylan alpha-1,2-glucuronidase n=1 Tax=Echinicola soli TaxID=2591634 RepID=A0A514CHQ3_9BACT|nr:alpha-glucuronidase family glycosyl hydrolase [Echinicola soli]QDH79174.1 alpha-glucuronidase [Echinicola soli]